MHRQREGSSALRIWGQSLRGETLRRSKGGQFIVHAKALPGKPYDGHTLGTIIPEIERRVGGTLKRIPLPCRL
jgi:hypothetical protein